MKQLKTIQNYIYGKGILSSFKLGSLIGKHKGKEFKIFYSKQNLNKRKHQLIINISNKLYYPKDTREIVRLLS